MPKGAALRLDVMDEAGTLTLDLYAGGSDTRLMGWTVGTDDVNAVIDELRDTLEEILSGAGDQLDLDEQRSADTVNKLLHLSDRVGQGLFEVLPHDFYEATRQHAYGALTAKVPARVVEVTAPPRFSYPFELLKWRDVPTLWQDPRDGPGTQSHEWWDLAEEERKDPAVRARALLGMSAIIRRGFEDPAGEAYPDRAPPGNEPAQPGNEPAQPGNELPLPVTVFCDPTLVESQREIEYLENAQGLVKVYGPWPKEGEFEEWAAARYIMDTSVGFKREPCDPVATVLHLACHCDTTGSPNKHFLALGGLYGNVTLGDLKEQLMAEAGKRADATGKRPMVFLNACGTDVPQLADRSSFTTFLLKRGFRGVLGTVCDIYDSVAAHFAVVFFEALLNGMTVGEAMYEARWHLMDKHGNPMGLFYTFHGNVDLQLSRPIVGGVASACPPAAVR